VGGAPALLSRRRLAALAALVAALAAYYSSAESWWNASLWWDVAWIAGVEIPAVFALVYLVVPLARTRGLPLIALALVAFAVVTTAAGLGTVANFAKLAAVTAVAFWLLSYLEDLALIVVVAAIIPFVDAWSVWRGPTHEIVTQRRHIFTTLSFAFPVPGEHGSANLGLPDLLFFAIFLGASVRFGLRSRWTWLAMTASFGATLAISVAFEIGGLPALPGLSIGFLLVNGDLLWRKLRRRGAPKRG
jgi:Na+/H+-dicarboxylate symporter